MYQASNNKNFALNDIVLRFNTTKFLKLDNVPVHEQRTLSIPNVLFHVYAENMSLLGAFWSRDGYLDVNQSTDRPFPLLVMTFEDKSPEALMKRIRKEPWHPPPGNTTAHDVYCADEQEEVKEEEKIRSEDYSIDAPILYFDHRISRTRSLGYHVRLPFSSDIDARVWILRGG